MAYVLALKLAILEGHEASSFTHSKVKVVIYIRY